MSSGSIIEDGRSPSGYTCSGAVLSLGNEYQRIWSGNNSVKGMLTPNPYSGFYARNETVPLEVTYYNSGEEFARCTNPFRAGDYIAIPTWKSSHDMVVLSRLAGKIKEHDFNAAIFVGELGKTVDMVSETVKTLTKAAISVKKGNFSQAARLLNLSGDYNRRKRQNRAQRDPRSDWLALRYGWRPMLSDIYEMSKAISQLSTPRKTTIRSSFKLPIEPPEIFDYNGVNIAKASGAGSYVKRIIAVFYERPLDLEQHLGLDNPLGVAWEFVPLSFVVDWFLPIGNYLDVRNTITKAECTFISTTYIWYKYSLSVQGIMYNGNPIRREWNSATSNTAFYSVNRSISTSLNVPTPSFRNPIPENGKDAGARFLDALSLFSKAIFDLDYK